MKKLIIILIVLSFVGVCLAASIQDMHRAVIARRNAGGTPAPTYLLHEDFESGSETFSSCGDSDNVYAWVQLQSGNEVNCNYSTSPAPLEGAESLYADGYRGYASFTPSDNKIYVTWKQNVIVSDAANHVFEIRDPDGLLLVCVSMEDGTTRPRVNYDDVGDGGCSGNSGLDTQVFTVGTTYHFKLEYDNGTGSQDGTVAFYWSPDPFTSWTHLSGRDISDASDLQAGRISVYGNDNLTVLFDDIRVDDEDITY